MADGRFATIIAWQQQEERRGFNQKAEACGPLATASRQHREPRKHQFEQIHEHMNACMPYTLAPHKDARSTKDSHRARRSEIMHTRYCLFPPAHQVVLRHPRQLAGRNKGPPPEQDVGRWFGTLTCFAELYNFEDNSHGPVELWSYGGELCC